MVYISSYDRHIISKHYGKCGLENSILELIEDLPSFLSSQLGKSEEFWRQELNNPASQLHSLNLLSGAIEFAINKAKSLSEKTGQPLCEYLEKSIENNWIGKWLTGYIKEMLREHYKLEEFFPK